MSAEIKWYVGGEHATEERVTLAIGMLVEACGGVTVAHSTGGYRTDGQGAALPPEKSIVFTCITNSMAAEGRARSMADGLLDIFDEEDDVLFTLSYVHSSMVSRPSVNTNDTDRSRVARARGEYKDE